jgi:hypothetical protein
VPECAKLFKAENFWRKHVEKRHAEWFDKIQRNVSVASPKLTTEKILIPIPAIPRECLCLGSFTHRPIPFRCQQQRTLPSCVRSWPGRYSPWVQSAERALPRKPRGSSQRIRPWRHARHRWCRWRLGR